MLRNCTLYPVTGTRLQAVVRRRELREFFSCVVWVALSQQPQVQLLQARVFEQLANKTYSGDAITVERMCDELREAATGRTILVAGLSGLSSANGD